MNIIDLRSDTVTMPTEGMRRAMMSAEVGDDVYGDDPTVKRLEELSAAILKKEAALFVPSGTMGNQLAIMSQTRRGDEIIADVSSHIVWHEVGAAAVLSGVNIRTVKSVEGRMEIGEVKAAVRPDDIHEPTSAMLCLENAHGCGRVPPLEYMADMRAVADNAGLRVHLDGARIFNAALVLGCQASDIARHADTVMFCLSKGLCAPVGSMLCGDAGIICRARKNRKLLGGGMRQAGILAAAGIVALESMRERLAEDHENAAYLASLLSESGAVSIRPVEINMAFVSFPGRDASGLHIYLRENGVLANPCDASGIRFVTHHGITRRDIERTASLLLGWRG